MSTRKQPSGVTLWAIIQIGRRAEWINWTTISRTRSEAWKKYAENWTAEAFKKHRRKGRARKPGGVYAAQVHVMPL